MQEWDKWRSNINIYIYIYFFLLFFLSHVKVRRSAPTIARPFLASAIFPTWRFVISALLYNNYKYIRQLAPVPTGRYLGGTSAPGAQTTLEIRMFCKYTTLYLAKYIYIVDRN